MAGGESRTELLAWLNDILQPDTAYTKIEQLGTGAAYTQIIDSIYVDVPLTKVKFNAKHEYEYLANFKVLQTSFDKHKIDKAIPVEKLVKCKFQDNLEFCQWLKKFWDIYYSGEYKDPEGRRKGKQQLGQGGSGSSTAKAPPRKAGPGAAGRPSSRTTTQPGSGRLSSNSGSSSAVDNHSASMIIELNKQITELKVTVDGLEKERDFYFGKLRDIEIIVQQRMEVLEAEGRTEDTIVLKEVQDILYSTEEGFEVPAEGEEGVDPEDETF